MTKKRGQAALEFLMTYGWAILVVLVVIGTLAYFGVLNPSFLLPEKCTLQMGLYCNDHRIDADSSDISLKLNNGMGKGIIISRIKITDSNNLIYCDQGVGSFDGIISTSGCDTNSCASCGNYSTDSWANESLAGSYFGCNPNPNFRTSFNDFAGWHLENGGDGTITLPCSRMSQEQGKVKVGISLVYHFDDSSPKFSHTMEGELLAKMESLQI